MHMSLKDFAFGQTTLYLVDDNVTVTMPGGDLALRREASGNLVQSGPARRVYHATVDLADFA